MRRLGLLMVLLLFALMPAGRAQGRRPPVLVGGLAHSATWYADMDQKQSQVPLHFHTKVAPRLLVLGPDHPNGTRVVVVFARAAVNLTLVAPKLGGDFDAFNEYGDLNPGYYIEAGEYTFEPGQPPNIVVAVGNGRTDLRVTVFRYHPPASQADAIREENWEVVGSFDGQQRAYLRGHSVVLPFGGQGLESEYTWVRHRFVETDDRQGSGR